MVESRQKEVSKALSRVRVRVRVRVRRGCPYCMLGYVRYSVGCIVLIRLWRPRIPKKKFAL